MLPLQKSLNGHLGKTNEAILIFANGPFQFLTSKFIPRSSPDELTMKQDDFNLNIVDGDYSIEFLPNIPNFEQAIILEVDKRYDFDPSSLWNLDIKIIRGNDTIFSIPLAKYLSFNIQPVKKYFSWIRPWITSPVLHNDQHQDCQKPPKSPFAKIIVQICQHR